MPTRELIEQIEGLVGRDACAVVCAAAAEPGRSFGAPIAPAAAGLRPRNLPPIPRWPSAFLDFEQPIAELEAKIDELQLVSSDAEVNIERRDRAPAGQEPRSSRAASSRT